MEQEQTTVTEPLPSETLTSSEETENTFESYVIDYSPQLSRIEQALDSINEQLETSGSVSYLEDNNVSFISGEVNNTDIFSVLLMIVIMLGLIFGALVFRHFRK